MSKMFKNKEKEGKRIEKIFVKKLIYKNNNCNTWLFEEKSQYLWYIISMKILS